MPPKKRKRLTTQKGARSRLPPAKKQKVEQRKQQETKRVKIAWRSSETIQCLLRGVAYLRDRKTLVTNIGEEPISDQVIELIGAAVQKLTAPAATRELKISATDIDTFASTYKDREVFVHFINSMFTLRGKSGKAIARKCDFHDVELDQVRNLVRRGLCFEHESLSDDEEFDPDYAPGDSELEDESEGGSATSCS
jgi:hypothetical protein